MQNKEEKDASKVAESSQVKFHTLAMETFAQNVHILKSKEPHMRSQKQLGGRR